MRPQTRVMLALIVTMCLIGCSSRTMQISDTYPKMAAEVPFTARYPIAREIRYTLCDSIVIDDDVTSWIATNEQQSKTGKSARLPFVSAAPTAGTRASDVYKQKAVDAAEAGRHRDAAFFNQQSHSSLQTEQAMDRMVNESVAMMNMFNAMVNALAAAVEEDVSNTAKALSKWTADTTNCIGDSAPPGSVLHLYFYKVLGGKSFQLNSETNLVVTATLEDGHGKVIQSIKGVKARVLFNRDPELGPQKGFVMDNEECVPVEKRSILKPLGGDMRVQQLGVLAHSAIGDLYARTEAIKGERKHE